MFGRAGSQGPEKPPQEKKPYLKKGSRNMVQTGKARLAQGFRSMIGQEKYAHDKEVTTGRERATSLTSQNRVSASPSSREDLDAGARQLELQDMEGVQAQEKYAAATKVLSSGSPLPASPPHSPPLATPRSVLSPGRSTDRSRPWSPPGLRARASSPDAVHRGYRAKPEEKTYGRQRGRFTPRDPGVPKQRKQAVDQANSMAKELKEALATLQAEKAAHAADKQDSEKAEKEALVLAVTAMSMVERLKMERDSAVGEVTVLTSHLQETKAKKAAAIDAEAQISMDAPMSPSRDPVFLEGQVQLLTKQLEDVKEEKDMLEKSAAKLERTVADHKNEISSLKTALKSNHDDAQAEVDELSKQLKKAHLDLNTQTEAVAAFRARCEELAQEGEELRAREKNAAEEALLEKQDALCQARMLYESAIERQDQEQARLFSRLGDATKKLGELETEKHRLMEELALYASGNAEEAQSINRHRMEELIAEIERLKGLLQAATKEMARVHQEYGLGWGDDAGPSRAGLDDEDYAGAAAS